METPPTVKHDLNETIVKLDVAREQLAAKIQENEKLTREFEAFLIRSRDRVGKTEADLDEARKQVKQIGEVPGISKKDHDELARWTDKNIVAPAKKAHEDASADVQAEQKRFIDQLNGIRDEQRAASALVKVLERVKTIRSETVPESSD